MARFDKSIIFPGRNSMRKLAVITTEYLKNFTEKSLAKIGMFDYEIYIYDNFNNITDTFDQIPREIDGVITNSRFAAETIRHTRPDRSLVVTSYDADDAGIYWLLIQLMRDKKFNPARVYVDFFDVLGIDLEEFLYSPPKTIISDLLIDYMKEMTLERLLQIERFCINRHMTLWQQGKTDISITRFSSIAQHLKNHGAPVRFAFPSINHIKEICQQALWKAEIKSLRQNLLAVIEVTVAEASSNVDQLKALENELNHFKKIHLYDFMLTAKPLGFEIFTSRKTVDELTDEGKGCRLQDYFNKSLKTPIHIGYGIGDNIYQARVNAVNANHEAQLRSSGGSCLINENDEMISRLESLNSVVVKRGTHSSLRRTVKKSGLSPITIQRIVAIARERENHRVTSQDVAGKMGITRRSANRFLCALIRARAARIVSVKNSTTKGRPERVYQITITD